MQNETNRFEFGQTINLRLIVKLEEVGFEQGIDFTIRSEVALLPGEPEPTAIDEENLVPGDVIE